MTEHPTYQKMLECIRNARIEQRISQQEMAGHLGIKQANYAKMENNQLELKVPLLIRIFEVLKISEQQLVRCLLEGKQNHNIKKDQDEGVNKQLIDETSEHTFIKNILLAVKKMSEK